MQKWLGQDKFLSALPRPPAGPHANERPSGSVRGAPGNRRPYRDHHLRRDGLPLFVRLLTWWDGMGSSLADVVHYGRFHNLTVFQVHPFPTSVALAEERLFFILAVLEMLIAVEAVVEDAGQHLSDVAARVHHLGRVQIIYDRPQRTGLIRLAIGVEAESRVAH